MPWCLNALVPWLGLKFACLKAFTLFKAGQDSGLCTSVGTDIESHDRSLASKDSGTVLLNSFPSRRNQA
jgi:hypothetical protein